MASARGNMLVNTFQENLFQKCTINTHRQRTAPGAFTRARPTAIAARLPLAMRLVLISQPAIFPGEPKLAASLLRNGAATLHLRKPDARVEDVCDATAAAAVAAAAAAAAAVVCCLHTSLQAGMRHAGRHMHWMHACMQVARLLDEIPSDLHPRIMLHQYHQLAERYDVKVHQRFA